MNIYFSPSFVSITLVRRKEIEGALSPAHCKGNKFTTCTDPLQGPLQLTGVLPRKILLHGVLQLMGWTETVHVPLTAANQLFYVLCAT